MSSSSMTMPDSMRSGAPPEAALSISAAAAEAGDRVGLVHEGRPYTFAELAERARSAGQKLARLHDRACVIVGERDLDTVLAIHAALDSHVPMILLHPRAQAAERERMLELCRDLVPDHDLAAVLFTSGSSGHPKGVLLHRAAFVASAQASARRLGWHAHDRWLVCLPLAHIGGLSILTRCLMARTAAVLDHGRFEPLALAATIEREQVTLLSLVPTMLQALLDTGWSAPPCLRAVLLGGAPASSALLARAAARHIPVLVTYGMTETCSQVCTQMPGTIATQQGRIGPPLPGVDVRIAWGRIHVRGPMLFRGYLGAIPPVDHEGFFDTGDRGWLDDEGVLHVEGRDDHTIITGGENVHPGEIEAVLEAHPAIAAACVFGVADPVWGEIVACAVVCRDPALPLDLAEFLAARLATYRRPRLICELAELPLGTNHKLDRERVRALAASKLRALPYP